MTAKELTMASPVGSRVTWKTLDGRRHEGTLTDWDNGTAIVTLDDGRKVAVRGR